MRARCRWRCMATYPARRARMLTIMQDDDVLLEAARDAAHANDDLKFVAVTPEHGKVRGLSVM